MQDIIGIDISKDRLDAFRLSDRQHNAFGNDKAGFKALLKWIGSAEGLRIVYEPTGPYHRGMEAALADVGHALVKVNPRQARRFAEATGTQAKTDRVDAMLLARMGLALDLPPRPVRGELMNELRELHVARLALIKDRTATGNRADTATIGLIRRQAKARLAIIEKQLAEVDEAITARIADDPDLAERLGILTSIPGIGAVTACMLLIEMPGARHPRAETGCKPRRAGAVHAPFGKVEGQGDDPRRTRQLCAPRSSLPALVAIRFNADLKRKYQQLIRWRESAKARDHRRHAKAHPARQRAAARRPEMGRQTYLTKTDTTALRQASSQRRKSVHPTSAKGCSSSPSARGDELADPARLLWDPVEWREPDGNDAAMAHASRPAPTRTGRRKPTPSQEAGQHGMNLATTAALWPTPQIDSFRSRGGERKEEKGLDRMARDWPTPMANDGCKPSRGQPTDSGLDPCQPDVDDADGARSQGWGHDIGEYAGERPAWPPGPCDADGWERYLRAAPDLEPAVRRGADGLAHRVDRLRLCGNGVVPLVAAHALRTLAAELLADG